MISCLSANELKNKKATSHILFRDITLVAKYSRVTAVYYYYYNCSYFTGKQRFPPLAIAIPVIEIISKPEDVQVPYSSKTTLPFSVTVK